MNILQMTEEEMKIFVGGPYLYEMAERCLQHNDYGRSWEVCIHSELKYRNTNKVNATIERVVYNIKSNIKINMRISVFLKSIYDIFAINAMMTICLVLILDKNRKSI